MKKIIFISLLLLAISISANENKAAKKEAKILDFPTTWRYEKIPFPLDFAPKIAYKGFEELRFAPGMFKPKKQDFFTYIFTFWVEGKVHELRLIEDLHKYYEGLYKAVATSRKLKADAKVKATLKKDKKQPYKNVIFYQVQIDWVEPFVTSQQQKLHFKIYTGYDNKAKRGYIFPAASPQVTTHKIWQELDKLTTQFLQARGVK